MSRISNLRSPGAVQAALDEFMALGREAFLKRYGYRKSRDFLVRNPRTGELCDCKAIAGVAYGKQYVNEGPLADNALSGVEKNIVPTLQALGYEVVRIGEDWSAEEVDAAVTEYFNMLRFEADDLRYNKTEHNNSLRQHLRNRS